MSKKLVLVAALLVLVGAMGLKTAVAAKTHGAVLVANGCAPPPPTPWK